MTLKMKLCTNLHYYKMKYNKSFQPNIFPVRVLQLSLARTIRYLAEVTKLFKL